MIYKITKYNLIGKVLTVFEPMPTAYTKDVNGVKKFYYVDGSECYRTHLWEYSETIPTGAIPHTEKFLPYFGDVTEDFPRSLRLKAKTYKNCQLMTEKHGGYLQFYHAKSMTVLRIAINSNTYTPIKNEKNIV